MNFFTHKIKDLMMHKRAHKEERCKRKRWRKKQSGGMGEQGRGWERKRQRDHSYLARGFVNDALKCFRDDINAKGRRKRHTHESGGFIANSRNVDIWGFELHLPTTIWQLNCMSTASTTLCIVHKVWEPWHT
jgi:hypothetical protein